MQVLKMSNSNDQAIATRENKQFELEYKAILEEAIKRVDKYNQNKFKAYTFLWKNVDLLCKIILQEEAISIQKSSKIL